MFITVRPDVGEKSSPNFPKVANAVSHKSEVFQNSPKSCQSFGLLLLEILMPRTFKNHPFTLIVN